MVLDAVARRLDESMPLAVSSGSAIVDHAMIYVTVLGLVVMSGLFSGLTLGLLGLDVTELEIVRGGGTPKEQERARKIMEVRSDGNRLLCTLLLGNVAVNSLLSIFLSGIASGLVGFAVSTALIVVFGEILPQAVCARHALHVGELSLPVIRFVLCALAPAEMLEYMRVQQAAGMLDDDANLVMKGALDMKHKVVSQVMTPLEDVYMLSEDRTLDFAAVREIFEQGFSRVPIFQGSRGQIVGLLFVKDLIFVDPEEATPVAEYLHIFDRDIQFVDDGANLDDVLRVFKRGRGHLAFVLGGAGDAGEVGRPVGIVTLEDIVEEILGDEIIDESDVYVDVDNRVGAVADGWTPPSQETMARYVRRAMVVDYKRATPRHADSDAPPAAADVVYARGHAANFATLVLSGKLHIRAGRDGFRAEAGPWTLLGAQTLLLGAPGGHTFVPDFAAHVATDSVRCVHVSCEEKIKGAPRGRGISEELVNDPTVSRKDRLTARVQGRRKDLLRATATGAAVV
ncbi:hypothetical protein JL720_12621 [Aureococcus anophagefferens]|nr:hypothetical protein JL720_12621 [Aureococcus anophagefferens]